jgi:hypothetical protein
VTCEDGEAYRADQQDDSTPLLIEEKICTKDEDR